VRHTFYLIGCEACGHFEPPPKPTPTAVIAPPAEPMRCADCGDLLLLIECWIADEAVMWQERPGAMWHHVPFADRLPTTDGRRLFV
jgi:hypothetical protein